MKIVNNLNALLKLIKLSMKIIFPTANQFVFGMESSMIIHKISVLNIMTQMLFSVNFYNFVTIIIKIPSLGTVKIK